MIRTLQIFYESTIFSTANKHVHLKKIKNCNLGVSLYNIMNTSHIHKCRLYLRLKSDLRRAGSQRSVLNMLPCCANITTDPGPDSCIESTYPTRHDCSGSVCVRRACWEVDGGISNGELLCVLCKEHIVPACHCGYCFTSLYSST